LLFVFCLEQRRLSLALEISPANTYTNGAILGECTECTELLTAPYLPPVDDLTYLPPTSDPFFRSSSNQRASSLGNEQQGNLRNCSKLRKRLEYRGRTVVRLGQNCGRFGTEFSGFLGSIFTPFLAFLRPPWSPVEWTFRRFGPIVIGLARPIFDHFWTVLLSVFSDTWKSEYASCRTKIPWTCVCPSRTRVSIR
jgi:hypothetical protein